MAKSNNRQSQKNFPAQPARQVPRAAAAPVKDGGVRKGLTGLQADMLAVAAILVVTFLALKVSLLNQFTNWDDPGYVVNQPLIKDLSAVGLRNIFTKPVMGNYHPLTMLTYAIDYSLANLNPFSYHLQSLLFHLATTALVFCFVLVLTRRRIAAIITALLFGLHPMHVESVAWAAGRKDVVYGAFYIASCIAWVYYCRSGEAKKWKWYAGALLMFLCSLLAKPVAVSLPLTLLIIDYFENRTWKSIATGLVMPQEATIDYKAVKFNFPVLLEKLPFFAISVGFGIKSMYDQRVFGALGTQGEKFNFIERIGLGGYALVTYLWKAVAPVKLLCFYPYPLKENGALPAMYYIYPAIALSLLFVVGLLFRKNKAVVFGTLFFLVNIALLLQFIPVGGAIIADRYSYIPYLGLFFILGWFVSVLFNDSTKQQLGRLAFGGVMAYCLVLGYLSNERCKVWYDGVSLWRDEIEIEPMRAPNGYNNLGFFYFSKFNGSVNAQERKLFYDSSYYLLTRAIELQSTFVNPYISLGELLRSNGQFTESKVFYYKALKLDTADQASNAYLGLAIVYAITRNADSALFCFNKTLALQPYNPEAHSNYANFLDMTGKSDSAIIQYGIAIDQNPDIVPPYLNRARALQRKGKCDIAFKDFDKALAIDPDMGEIYYARSMCQYQNGNKPLAVKDIEKARSLGFTNMDPNYLQSVMH